MIRKTCTCSFLPLYECVLLDTDIVVPLPPPPQPLCPPVALRSSRDAPLCQDTKRKGACGPAAVAPPGGPNEELFYHPKFPAVAVAHYAGSSRPGKTGPAQSARQ